MVKSPPLFISMFFLLYILSAALYIKIFEQKGQRIFSSYYSVIWYCIVTSSTVGYGDMIPRNIFGRIIGITLMIVGIGLISTLSALSVANIVSVIFTIKIAWKYRA